MPFKIGGRDKLQQYDPENGEYTDEEKAHFLEAEMINIMGRYQFGLKNTYLPRFPIYGFHSNEYCHLYVRHVITETERILDANKIKNYLLIFEEKSDKSIFFNNLGYYQKDWEEIYYQIMNNTHLSKMNFTRLTKHGLFLKAETKIKSMDSFNYLKVETVFLF